MKKLMVILAVAVAALMLSAPAQAKIGVGLNWDAGISPNMVLPIKMSSGLVIEPFVGFDLTDSLLTFSGKDEKNFRLGLSVEKQMKTEGITPLFGAFGAFNMTSIDFEPAGTPGSAKDSYTDFAFGVYLGGSVPVADMFDFVGSWGPVVTVFGSRFEGGDSAMNIGSQAMLTLRWWLWGE